jgi:hypothetical protein
MLKGLGLCNSSAKNALGSRLLVEVGKSTGWHFNATLTRAGMSALPVSAG